MIINPGIRRVVSLAANAYNFFLPMLSNLAVMRGLGPATFTRASSCYVPDHTGRIVKVLDNMPAYPGMRRGENQLPNSSNLLDGRFTMTGAATKTYGTVTFPSTGAGGMYAILNSAPAGTVVDCLYEISGSGTILVGQLNHLGSWVSEKVVALTATPQKFYTRYITTAVGNPAVGLRNNTGEPARTINVHHLQLIDRTGDPDTAPPEYVSTMVYGPEQSPSVTLDSATGFSIGANWAWVSSGVVTATGSTAQFLKNVATPTGKTFKIQYIVSGYVSGSISGVAGNSTGTAVFPEEGKLYTDYIVCGAGAGLGVVGRGAGFTGTLSYLSIQEVTSVPTTRWFDYENPMYNKQNKCSCFGVPRQDSVSAELNTGDLTTGVGYTTSGTDATHTITFGAGGARYQCNSATPALTLLTGAIFTVGKQYKIVIDTSIATGTIKTGGVLVVTLVNGMNTFYTVATSTFMTILRDIAVVDATIISWSVVEINDIVGTKSSYAAAGGAFNQAIPGQTLSGDTASTLTIVQEDPLVLQAALNDPALSDADKAVIQKCIDQGGKVYELVGGSGTANTVIAGTAGNTNINTPSVIARKLTAAQARHFLLTSGNAVTNYTTSTYGRFSSSGVATTTDVIVIQAGAGQSIRFIAPQLEENATAHDLLPTEGVALDYGVADSGVRTPIAPALGAEKLTLTWLNVGGYVYESLTSSSHLVVESAISTTASLKIAYTTVSGLVIGSYYRLDVMLNNVSGLLPIINVGSAGGSLALTQLVNGLNRFTFKYTGLDGGPNVIHMRTSGIGSNGWTITLKEVTGNLGNALYAKGLLSEPQAQNLLDYNNELGSWIKTGTGAAVQNLTGPDGIANSAWTVSGVDTTAYVYRTITGLITATRYEPSFYIKKIDVAGVIQVGNPLSFSSGNWLVDFSKLGSDWERITRTHPAVTISIEHTTGAGTQAGIIFAKSSGTGTLSFGFFGGQEELGTASTSYAPKVGTTGGLRAATNMNVPMPVGLDTEGTAYIEFEASVVSADGILSTYNGTAGGIILSTAVATGYWINDGAFKNVSGSTTTTGPNKMVVRWKGTVLSTFKNGVKLNDVIVDGNMNFGSTLGIGSNPSTPASSVMTGYTKNTKIYPRALSDAQCIALTK